MPQDSQVDEWRRPDAGKYGGAWMVHEPGCHSSFQWEAEYYAALKGASQALGFQSVLRDIGLCTSVTLFSDSSAARGIIHRAGLGKLRHLETGYLWLQAAVANKRLQVRKVNGTENPADLFTKFLSSADMWRHLHGMQMASEEGRSDVAPRI